MASKHQLLAHRTQPAASSKLADLWKSPGAAETAAMHFNKATCCFCLQDVGQKQVASVLGIQAARANTAPRPFLKLKPQHIAVQVHHSNAPNITAMLGSVTGFCRLRNLLLPALGPTRAKVNYLADDVRTCSSSSRLICFRSYLLQRQ